MKVQRQTNIYFAHMIIVLFVCACVCEKGELEMSRKTQQFDIRSEKDELNSSTNADSHRLTSAFCSIYLDSSFAMMLLFDWHCIFHLAWENVGRAFLLCAKSLCKVTKKSTDGFSKLYLMNAWCHQTCWICIEMRFDDLEQQWCISFRNRMYRYTQKIICRL